MFDTVIKRLFEGEEKLVPDIGRNRAAGQSGRQLQAGANRGILEEVVGGL